ncbi:hypothetical protein SteCoe_13992 [Stentor coeruleus]|uniref:PIPK domain-containing protein n=1 Tax=Stentor coeruleus TaxID=5963 RepID=A0A1R2C796_9CILI|nr:hypothetical protein SteCoe_13992 [Stentor coeruleus]
MISWFMVLTLAFLSISAICEILIIYGFAKLKRVRNYPGIYILVQSIAQLYIDIHWITIFAAVQETLSPFSCRLLGSLVFYAYTIAWNYTFFLSLEVYLKITSAVSKTSSKPKFYHIFGQVTSLAPGLILAFSNQNGKSGLGTCSIQAHSILEILWGIQIIIYAPLCLIFVILSFSHSKNNDKKLKNGLKYHLYVVLVFIFTITPAEIFDTLNWTELETPESELKILAANISVIIGAISGALVFVARFSQKNLLRSLWKAIINKRTIIGVDENILNINLLPYTDLFAYLEDNKHIRNAFTSLYMIFSSLSDPFSKHESLDRTWKFDLMNSPCKVTQHNYNYFIKVFKSENLTKASLLNSFSLDSNFDQLKTFSTFKSENHFTFLTHDKKYFVKSISEDCLDFLCNITEEYIKRLIAPSSFLLSIYGLFTIEYGNSCKVDFMVYENLGFELKNPKKAVLVGESKFEDPFVVDLYANFNSILGHEIEKIMLPKIQIRKILKAIEFDVKMLSGFTNLQYYLKVVYDENVKYLHNMKKMLVFDGKVGFIGIIFVCTPERRKGKAEEYRAKFLQDAENIFVREKAS